MLMLTVEFLYQTLFPPRGPTSVTSQGLAVSDPPLARKQCRSHMGSSTLPA